MTIRAALEILAKFQDNTLDETAENVIGLGDLDAAATTIKQIDSEGRIPQFNNQWQQALNNALDLIDLFDL